MNLGLFGTGFSLPILHCAIRKSGYLQKYRYFHLGLFPNSGIRNNFAMARRSSQVLSTTVGRQPSLVYHNVRSLLYTTRWAWKSASRGFICSRLWGLALIGNDILYLFTDVRIGYFEESMVVDDIVKFLFNVRVRKLNATGVWKRVTTARRP